MTKRESSLFHGLLAAFAALVACAIVQIFLFTPRAQVTAGGLAQKILYFHAPIAFGMYACGAVCFIASGFYLAKPSEHANAWARAGSDCAALFGSMVLCSGPLWAKKAWGAYWVWDPQLTTLLLSALIYYSITLLRSFGGEGVAERRFAAALGILGAINLPIIHYSVQKWGGNHPVVQRAGGGGLDPSMKLSFWLGVVSLTCLLPALLLWLRSRLARLDSQVEQLREDALGRGFFDASESAAEAYRPQR